MTSTDKWSSSYGCHALTLAGIIQLSVYWENKAYRIKINGIRTSGVYQTIDEAKTDAVKIARNIANKILKETKAE